MLQAVYQKSQDGHRPGLRGHPERCDWLRCPRVLSAAGVEQRVVRPYRTGLVQDSRKYSIKNFEFDELLPGGGRFYCPETARHFINANALAAHKKTKEYKKRCRELKKTPYSQEEADRAAGLMKETYTPIDREALAKKAAAAEVAKAAEVTPEDMDI